MQKRVEELINDKGQNYILPFMWLRGESKELLIECMEKIYESGIRAVCLEARPHPDFVGPLWWRDLDIILEKAKELHMKVWILDDSHFPTGRCNDKITPDSPYRKFVLTHYGIDMKGPMREASFIIDIKENETLVGVVAAKRPKGEEYTLTDVIDITGNYNGDVVEWNVPEGYWNIIVIKVTDQNAGRAGYANLIDKDAVRFFLDTIYEPHYERYKNEFGGTIAGFFSDEPGIGNTFREIKDAGNSRAGIPDIPLPWCKELENKLKLQWGDDYCINLAALWNTIDDSKATYKTGEVRKEYTDIVTRLYQKNFGEQVGNWCRAHNVEYIGHVIEEARLGVGAGHYFRALWGQDMAGIDVVLQQTRPELDDVNFYAHRGTTLRDGIFPHYGLAKLASSLAHIDGKKKGRAMCEIYGAYGWTEGVKSMKWLTDHMLVRGINYFVPHGFSMRDFPDRDCPPHFYARGNNPQFEYFKLLMKYLNRVSHLIDGGVHCADVGIVYSQELEWLKFGVMDSSRPGMILAQNQIDYDILPIDLIIRTAVRDNKLLSGAEVYEKVELVGQEQIRVLVIPECHYLEEKFANWCIESISKGLQVICVNTLPKILNENGIIKEWEDICPEVIQLEYLGEVLRERRAGLDVSITAKYLRYYHYSRSDGDCYLLFNEGVTEEIHTQVRLSVQSDESVVLYDAWENTLKEADWDEKSNILNLSLSPYEMKIVIVSKRDATPISKDIKIDVVKREIDLTWDVYLKKPKDIDFTFYQQFKKLINITKSDESPNFCGTMKYVTDLMCEEDSKVVAIDFGDVYETAKLFVNKKLVGVKITPPYKFEIGQFLKVGSNKIELEVTNTVVHQVRDWISMTMPIEPSGVLGPITLITKK